MSEGLRDCILEVMETFRRKCGDEWKKLLSIGISSKLRELDENRLSKEKMGNPNSRFEPKFIE